MIVLNAAVAQQLIAFKKETDALIDKGVKKDEAIFQVLRKYIIACKKIRFEGNGYSKEWQEEAQKRGLSVDNDCITALKAYLAPKAKKLFVENGVFTERELEARFPDLPEEERCRMAERIHMLTAMWREARDLAVLTERYYERGYRRNARYTL